MIILKIIKTKHIIGETPSSYVAGTGEKCADLEFYLG